jgi:type I restriction enzyme S subunit
VVVREGYKQTDAGVIPEDWSVAPLSAITSEIGDGIHATPIYSSNGNYFFINGNNIRGGRIVITDDTKAVNESEFKKHHKNLNNRSILMSINGTIGSLGLFAGEHVVLGKSAAYLTIKAEFPRAFVYHIMQTDLMKRQFSDGLTGTTIKNLGLAAIRNAQILLPPTKAEQEAIAEALSDADALIESLEQLLAKKRHLKQGVMQELLTGKRRLPSFIGEWETKRLGDLVLPLKKTTRPSSAGKTDGAYPFFTNSTKPAGKFLDEFDFNTEAIIANTGGEAFFNYYRGPFAAMADCLVFVTRSVTKFLYYVLKSIESFINENGFTGSGIKHLDKKFFANVASRIPIEHAEQTAIATILSDMDADIATLEAKLAKARQIKQGMMQELLTGRIRLL